MCLRFFMIPVRDASATEQELNGFISSQKILSIDRHQVDAGSNSFWTICVDYMSSMPGEATRQQNLSRNRIDYKTILLADEFAVFSRLRETQKELAQGEAVPAYALFTYEQLAQMVQRRCRSKSDLSKIDGIGEIKIDKYADRLLPHLTTLSESKDAPCRESI